MESQINSGERQQHLRNYVRGLFTGDDQAKSFVDLGFSSVESRIENSRHVRNEREARTCRDAHAKLLNCQELNSHEQFLYEAIVLQTERPALLVRDSSYDRPPTPWASLDDKNTRDRLSKAIRSVGRVEVSGPDGLETPPYGGTAFVVGPGLLMTNSHVAKLFATGRGTRVSFREGYGSAIDFGKEKGQDVPSTTHPVREIVMRHPYWDMAVLRVPSLPVRPLELSPVRPEDCVNRGIAVIGYPAKDPRGDQRVQERVFGSDFGVKRLQPGYARGPIEFRDTRARIHRTVLSHDASTLGGNSGSAVVDVSTGKVIALHFAGQYGLANYAIPVSELSRDGRIRDCGVAFTDGTSERPNPWLPEWEQVNAEHTGSSTTTDKPDRRKRTASAVEFTIPINISIQIRNESE